MKKTLSRKQKMMIQRLIGIAMLILSVFFVWMVSTEPRIQDRDAGAVFVLIPIALYYLFAKKPFMF